MWDIGRIPCADDMAAAIGGGFNLFDQLGDLVDRSLAGPCVPMPPLGAIDGTEVPIFICPFVPNGNAVFLEVSDIGIAFEEPKKFVNDRAEVEFFCGEEREGFAQRVAGLGTED